MHNKPGRIIKLEYFNETNNIESIHYNNAELVLNMDTKNWDIDLRGVVDVVGFDYEDKLYLTIYLDTGEIFKGKVFVNIGGTTNSFNLQGKGDLVRVKQ